MSLKYTDSVDGEKRTTIRCSRRLSKGEVALIRRYLRYCGRRADDTGVREFVRRNMVFETPDLDDWVAASEDQKNRGVKP